ncbi:MAG: hypothetical protein AVDCRST_MAG87-1891 [uncultured Thermomicrobiales bacterium]|uniref:Uncharacterized protein n=1 Tax=uncultured Thermomicrobiales bacterium TaxID=1645740 RepID=A0A6J4V4I3_9BACT|nr:MAG: hypothetical protein AVDCRST_MAG87-1891 [uncultured Thermomicrobiales bacterium]
MVLDGPVPVLGKEGMAHRFLVECHAAALRRDIEGCRSDRGLTISDPTVRRFYGSRGRGRIRKTTDLDRLRRIVRGARHGSLLDATGALHTDG